MNSTWQCLSHQPSPVTGGFPVGSRSEVWEEPLGCWLDEGQAEAEHRCGQHSLSHRLESSRCHLDPPCQGWVSVLSVCSRPRPPHTEHLP